ncbi:MAG: heme biosynthesis protein HemY [Rhizobiales bacterium]|nr:heme biosynthesis protein HemY [Hyphomicrobiales bacterium]
MIRVAVFLLLVALLASGVAWVADRPGDVAITWHGWRIETSIMVAFVALATLVALAIVTWTVFRGVVRSPGRLAERLRRHRETKGYLAITRGLIAIGAGDAAAARKYAEVARRLAFNEPLALLLGAQTAQMSSDRDAAEVAFRAMAGRDDTKLLGLRGLFVEAQRRGDSIKARMYAEEAANTAISLGWAGQAVLQFRCVAGDWNGALSRLESSYRHKLLDKATYRRQRAVLLTAQAASAERRDRDAATALALEAVKLAPTLVPAAALAGRLLAEAAELRRASRIVEKAWGINPHPDLADTYLNLRSGDSALDRLARIRTLVEKSPEHIESALALARAAIDAREFTVARDALTPFLAEPTRRIAMMMAEIEETERGDVGRAREWMARALRATRDPAWTADGFVSEHWMPISPVTGRLDAFEWKVPLAEIEAKTMPAGREADGAATIEAEPTIMEKTAGSAAEEPKTAAMPLPIIPLEPQGRSAVQAGARAAASSPRSSSPTADSRPVKTDAIIPLVHVPDDPGPEPDPESDTVPGEPNEGWRGLRPFTK